MNGFSPTTRKFGAAGLVLAVLIPFAFKIGDIYVDPSDPGFGARGLPRLIVGIGIFLALILAWQGWRERPRTVGGSNWRVRADALRGPLFIVVVAFAYIWAITAFQYALPTLALLVCLSWYFGSRGARDLVVIPLAAVLLYYLVFFVALGIFEEPGSVLSYDSYGFSRELRRLIGLQ